MMDAWLNEFVTDMMDRQVYRDGISDVGLPLRIAIFVSLFSLFCGVYFI
jgi:hypothetical protein|tara:strand:- start:113 stop:259 length:147 start_codon:yes stop_codon:yes gene_type:complete